MGVFEQFPYTNFHGVNLSWILEKVRDHETRISALEAQLPLSTADDVGKVLIATGAGTAAWRPLDGSDTIYLEFEDSETWSPEELVAQVLNNNRNVICYVIGAPGDYVGYHYAHLYGLLDDRLYFDSDEQFWGAVGHSTPPSGMKRCQVEYRDNHGTLTWHLYNMDGAKNERGEFPSEEDEILKAAEEQTERK